MSFPPRHFYTGKLDEIDLAEIYPTYMAGNKYLASDLIQDLTDYITKSCENVSNFCVIYDQLKKLGIEDSLASDLKSKMMDRFSEACASPSFEKISRDTLVSILKFDYLNISEIELLKACLRWVDCEASRQHPGADPASKKTAFEPIKHLIRFGDLSLEGFASIVGIPNYFTMEEYASIFLHYSQSRNPVQIDYRSSRKPLYVAQIQHSMSSSVNFGNELDLSISANSAVRISSIQTLYAYEFGSISSLEVLSDGKPTLNAEITKVQESLALKSFVFHFPSLVLDKDRIYTLRFKFDYNLKKSAYYNYYGIIPPFIDTSTQTSLSSAEAEVVFQLDPEHFIRSIRFFPHFE